MSGQDGYERFRFPHESLHVYRDSLEFLRCVQELSVPSGHAELRRQLSRAALSITLNICEGRSQKLAGNSGINFYRIALGSAAECLGALDALAIVGGRNCDVERSVVRRIGARMAGLLAAGRRS
ncbi:MAG: four helix bundle protein [Planctomycetota bacterium]